VTTRCVRYSTESKTRRLDALPEHRRATALPAQGCSLFLFYFLFLGCTSRDLGGGDVALFYFLFLFLGFPRREAWGPVEAPTEAKKR
jgi:hypothetical protein